jgi:mannose-1-phosphate guanylyltransferase
MKLVILAEDVGKKLWPATSSILPKALLPAYSDEPMLAETLARMVGAVDSGKDVFIVIPEDALGLFYETQLCIKYEIPPEHIIAVPSSRGSAISLYLVCEYLLRVVGLEEHEPLLVSMADQFFWFPANLAFHFSNFLEEANRYPDKITTFTVTPDRLVNRNFRANYFEISIPNIQPAGNALDIPGEDGKPIALRTKKSTAVAYHATTEADPLQNTNWYHDTSNHIGTIRMWREYIGKLLEPQLRSDIFLRKLDEAFVQGKFRPKSLYGFWDSIDHTELEGDFFSSLITDEKLVVVMSSNLVWLPVDSWIAIKFLLCESGLYPNRMLPRVREIGSQNNLVLAPPSKEVTLFGVDDLVVVDTGVKLLIGTVEGLYEYL